MALSTGFENDSQFNYSEADAGEQPAETVSDWLAAFASAGVTSESKRGRLMAYARFICILGVEFGREPARSPAAKMNASRRF
jgi:hypothetical protein